MAEKLPCSGERPFSQAIENKATIGRTGANFDFLPVIGDRIFAGAAPEQSPSR
jgi:hypothetical protein